MESPEPSAPVGMPVGQTGDRRGVGSTPETLLRTDLGLFVRSLCHQSV